MARYGIKVDDAFGVSLWELRRMAKPLRRDHELALALWATGNHEARLLATIVDDPALVDEAQMEAWVADLDSWDVCDQLTSNLFDKTTLAYDKAHEWAARDEEFVRRAAFAMIAALAVQDKAATGRASARLPPAHRGVRGRPAQLRQEGRELGPAQHRQAERRAQRGGGRVRAAHPRRRERARRRRAGRRPRRAQRAMGRRRRPARAHLGEGAGAPREARLSVARPRLAARPDRVRRAASLWPVDSR